MSSPRRDWMASNLDVQGYCLTAALVLGSVLLAVCGLVTVTNFCIPSTLLAIWWRWRGDAVGAESTPT